MDYNVSCVSMICKNICCSFIKDIWTSLCVSREHMHARDYNRGATAARCGHVLAMQTGSSSAGNPAEYLRSPRTLLNLYQTSMPVEFTSSGSASVAAMDGECPSASRLPREVGQPLAASFWTTPLPVAAEASSGVQAWWVSAPGTGRPITVDHIPDEICAKATLDSQT